MPTQAEINRWYDSFILELSKKGVETRNPLTFGAVRVLPKDECLEEGKYFQSNERDDIERDMKEVRNLMVPALVEHDANGNVKKPFDGKQDYTDYLMKNIKLDPSDEQKRFLWQMSREGRLVLQNEDPSMGPGADYPIWTGKHGKVVILDAETFFGPYETFHKGLYDAASDEEKRELEADRRDWLKQLDINDKQINAFFDKLAQLDQIYQDAETALEHMQRVREARVHELQGDSAEHPGHASQNNREIALIGTNHRKLIYHSHMWLEGSRLITGLANEHPEMFRNADDRKLLNRIALQQANKSENKLFRNKNYDEGAENYRLAFTRSHLDGVYKKLKELTGCRSYREMMERDAIRDSNGKPLPKESLFKYYLQLNKRLESGKDILIAEHEYGKEKLVPYQWHASVFSFYRSMNTSAYADQLSDIARQYDKAKLPGSQYLLKVKLDSIANAIRKAGAEKGTDNRVLLEKQLSGLVDAKFMKEMRVNIANKAKTGKLTDKDLQLVKLMNRTANLLYASRLGELNPAENYRMKLAEKICAARAIELSKSKDGATRTQGLKLLLYPSYHYAFLKRVMESPALDAMIGDKNAAEQDKLLRKDNKAVLKSFSALNGGPLMPLKDERFQSLPKELEKAPKTIGDARLQAGQLLNEITVARNNGDAYKALLSSAKELFGQTLAWSKEDPTDHLDAEKYRLFTDKLHAVCQALTDYAASDKPSDLSVLRQGAVILYGKTEITLEAKGISDEQLDRALVADLRRGKDGHGKGAVLARHSGKQKNLPGNQVQEAPEAIETKAKLTDFIVKEIIAPQVKGPVSDQLKEQLQKTIAFEDTLAYLKKRPNLVDAFQEADKKDIQKNAQLMRAKNSLANVFRGFWCKEIAGYLQKQIAPVEPKVAEKKQPQAGL